MKGRVGPIQALPAGEQRSEGQPTRPLDLERMRSHLTRSVDRVCPPWLAAFKDDIVQNAMIRVLQILEKDEHNLSPPASYVWKVAYSATVDQIRRIRRRKEVPTLAHWPRPPRVLTSFQGEQIRSPKRHSNHGEESADRIKRWNKQGVEPLGMKSSWISRPEHIRDL
jgi:DNA-directed RNA polymerase specialized sigma24 family protein